MPMLLKKIERSARDLRVFSNLRSAQMFRRLLHAAPKQGETEDNVSFALRPLNGNLVYCRPGTTDLRVLDDTFFGRYHLPPVDLCAPRRILDLGSNIGLTMAHFACLYPGARILGIELDERNVKMCQLNIAPYSSRCEIVWGAVWNQAGTVTYAGNEEWGFQVGETGEQQRLVEAHTMDSLIRHLGPPIDYVKMDIEGAESAVLDDPGPWIRAVRCLKIEIHEPYSVDACITRLEGLGMRCEVYAHHWACVIARNPRLPEGAAVSEASRNRAGRASRDVSNGDCMHLQSLWRTGQGSGERRHVRKCRARSNGKSLWWITIQTMKRVMWSRASADATRTGFASPYDTCSKPSKAFSFARNAGVRESRGDVLAFLDDDATVDAAWLWNLSGPLFSREWAGAGGRIIPVLSGPLPLWLSAEDPLALAPYGTFEPDQGPGPLTRPPFGSNMAFRKEIFGKYGGFRTDLGRSLGNLLGGEDTEFGGRLLANGERLYYAPSAVVHHMIPLKHLQKSYVLSWWFWHNISEVGESGMIPSGTKWTLVGIPLDLFRRLTACTLRWLISIEPSRRFSWKRSVWYIAGTITACRRWSRGAGTQAAAAVSTPGTGAYRESSQTGTRA